MQLRLSPHGTTAYLDDKPLGVGSNNYRVRPGRYILSAKKSGYRTRTQNISIEAGQQLTYEIDLQREKPVAKQEKSAAERARELETAGKFREALQQYENALRRNPKDLQSMLGKARCYHKLGQAEMAVAGYMQAAGIAANLNDFDSQIKALTGVIEIRPKTMTAYSSRGDLFFKRGNYRQAAKDYEQVVLLDRRNLDAYFKLGRSYYNNGQYQDALSAFQAAEDLNFAEPRAQVYMAETYLALNDKKKMKKAVEKFEEMASYSVRLQYKDDPDWQRVLEAVNTKE